MGDSEDQIREDKKLIFDLFRNIDESGNLEESDVFEEDIKEEVLSDVESNDSYIEEEIDINSESGYGSVISQESLSSELAFSEMQFPSTQEFSEESTDDEMEDYDPDNERSYLLLPKITWYKQNLISHFPDELI